jgi:hypothetical protein
VGEDRRLSAEFGHGLVGGFLGRPEAPELQVRIGGAVEKVTLGGRQDTLDETSILRLPSETRVQHVDDVVSYHDPRTLGGHGGLPDGQAPRYTILQMSPRLESVMYSEPSGPMERPTGRAVL